MGNFINYKDKLLYQQHIMWYESKMINEVLDSLQNALQYSLLPVDLEFCLNSQTYIEKPITGKPEEMFNEFLNHPLLQKAKITYKTNNNPFYNIGDWRRETYSNSYKYTIWGESDCLIPEDFFYILSNLTITHPHIISPASRKMGDSSWGEVEGLGLDIYPWSYPDRHPNIPLGYYQNDYITQQDLDKMNNFEGNVIINLLTIPKISGALLCLSPNLPKFIPNNMHFAREDYCANLVFIKKNIPHYVIKNRFGGHNYQHPLKRTNTINTREDVIYKNYERESIKAMMNFIKQI